MIILFHCGHAQEQKLSYECEDYCETCCKTVLIQDTWRESWHVSCTRCAYHTRHGYGKEKAHDSARLHLAQRGHNVKPRFYADAPPHVTRALREKRREKQTETLPIDPPF